MIVADTGAILALIDADDQYHDSIAELFEQTGESWVLPWAILPEVDYLTHQHIGARAAQALLKDIAVGALSVEWGAQGDVVRARELCTKYSKLELGLVDAVVIAIAERLHAKAIVTLDIRDFGAVRIEGAPPLWPRDV